MACSIEGSGSGQRRGRLRGGCFDARGTGPPGWRSWGAAGKGAGLLCSLAPRAPACRVFCGVLQLSGGSCPPFPVQAEGEGILAFLKTSLLFTPETRLVPDVEMH